MLFRSTANDPQPTANDPQPTANDPYRPAAESGAGRCIDHRVQRHCQNQAVTAPTASATPSPAVGPTTPMPQGFSVHVANIGIKDETDDFVVIASDGPAVGAGVFTQSRFAGPSVNLSRRSVADGNVRAFVVVSKNANVANGRVGADNADEVLRGVAAAIGCGPYEVVLASTGVIGRPYPMERVRSHLGGLRYPFDGTDARRAAVGMMTDRKSVV